MKTTITMNKREIRKLVAAAEEAEGLEEQGRIEELIFAACDARATRLQRAAAAARARNEAGSYAKYIQEEILG